MFEEIVSALSDYTVVLEPDHDTPEWWAGAPSVLRSDDGFYLAARMREGNSPRGLRGYEVRILRSEDGKRFQPVHHLKREDVGVPGFERPSLVRVPDTGKYRLYACAGLETGWAVLCFDDVDDPKDIAPRSWKRVLWEEPPDDGFAYVSGYKDPYVTYLDGQWHMFVIACDRVERIGHFLSDDGHHWRQASDRPFMENSGWHNFYTRPACVVPLAVGYLFVYEGSLLTWRDPVYNIATGLAYSPDLQQCIDLTPDAPLLKSTTPGDYATWRYWHWVRVGEQLYVYFEAARPNNSNEVRLGIVDLHG